MFPVIDNLYFYSRKNNILIANTVDGVQIPLYKFKQNFVDVIILSDAGSSYMKRYIEMFPELCERIVDKEPEQDVQLTLF